MNCSRKCTALILVCALSLMSTQMSFAATVWSDLNKAGAYESAGDLESAVPYWKSAFVYFQGVESIDAYTNAALMAKKLGQFYDAAGDYPSAVTYYEYENTYWEKLGKDWGTADMIRADEIRSYIHFYAQNLEKKLENETEKELDNEIGEGTEDGQSALQKFEPPSGVYLGLYAENDKAIGQHVELTESVYGKDHAIYMYYQNFNQWMNSADGPGRAAMDAINAKRVEEAGGALQVAMNAMEGLGVVEENDWLIRWAKEAASYDMPIFLRFCGEMNGDWVPWHGDPALYIEKFRLVHDVMALYAPNVAMVWCPNDVPVELDGQRIEDYYPGHAYVDWVGVNFYVDYYDSGRTDGPNNYLQNPLSHLQYIYEMYADQKPIMICETGVAHYSIPNGENVEAWGAANLEKFYSMLPVVYPRVKAITYLSLNQANDNYLVGNRWSNYALSENEQVQETYKRIIQSDIYLSQVKAYDENSAEAQYNRVEKDALFNQEELVLDIKVPDYKVSKVSVFSDTGYMKVMTQMPFVIDQEALRGQVLNIQVFDSTGKLVMNELIKK